MATLIAQVVRFVEEHQPPIVAAAFTDAEGKRHELIDKSAIFIDHSGDIRSDSVYPLPGGVKCEILARWHDHNGRELVRITTERPWSVESTDGTTEFVVLSSQLRTLTDRS